MNCAVLFFALVPSIIAFEYTRKKFNYMPGVICNYDVFPTITVQYVARYYCVPASLCNVVHIRDPMMPQTTEYCDDYLNPPPSGEHLTCCHFADITDNDTVVWSRTNAYLPGLRSWFMCRDNAQALCSPKGESYCSTDFTNAEPNTAIPSAIEEFPHTALVGQKVDYQWVWHCLGSIISRRFVLTAGKCAVKVYQEGLYVKVGESRICDSCPNHPEEQVIKVSDVTKRENDRWYYLDFAVLELSKDIKFNHLVRPACLMNDYSTRESQGWFAHYGKMEQNLITPMRPDPEFHPLISFSHNDSTISFRVKADEEVTIFFSNTGGPYQNVKNLEIVLGNTESQIKYNNEKTVVEPGIIINSFEYRGFWIHLKNDSVEVGKEDETFPFMTKKVADTNFKLMGINSPQSEGDWVFPDHYTLFALRGMELEVLYKDGCQQYYEGSPKLDKEGLKDDIMFCAGNLRAGKAPCDDEWGGTIQVMDDRHYCMWQIFGVFARDEPHGECSRPRRPSVFNSVTPELEWIENAAFRDFAIENITVVPPDCSFSDYIRVDINRC